MKEANEDIIKYIENTLSPEERKSFQLRMEESADFRKEVEDTAFIWELSGGLEKMKQIDTQKKWKEIQPQIKRTKLRLNIFKYTQTAAAILLLPILIVSIFLYNKLDSLSHVPVQQVEVTAPAGAISKILLSDGTEVWLNSGSTLSYPQQFRCKGRVVHLSGEAYFKVSSDKSNRFDVVSDKLLVSAYGTEFNVTTYKGESVIDVTLVKGNIDVTDVQRKITKNVQPGQQLLYNKTDKNMVVSSANLAVKTGWKDGRIIFRRTNMQDVTQMLSRHFNVDVRIASPELYEYEYSATFTTETLSEILQLLERTAPIQYKIIESKQLTDSTSSQKIVVLSMKN